MKFVSRVVFPYPVGADISTSRLSMNSFSLVIKCGRGMESALSGGVNLVLNNKEDSIV
jgi:hypothetical protein